MKVALALSGSLIGLLVLMLVVGHQVADPDRMLARDTIDLCWSDQQRKSLDPSTARLVASVCERMEADFTQTYGQKP